MGWLAAALTLGGMFIVGNKRRVGFLIALVGEVFWGLRGYAWGKNELIFLAAVFAIMDLRNWIHWGKK